MVLHDGGDVGHVGFGPNNRFYPSIRRITRLLKFRDDEQKSNKKEIRIGLLPEIYPSTFRPFL
jgi:hypothetical protein